MKLSKIIMLALVFSVTTTTYLNAQNQKTTQTVQYDFLKGLLFVKNYPPNSCNPVLDFGRLTTEYI